MLINRDKLIDIATGAGILLEPVDGTGDCYVWANPHGDVIYIGSSQDARERRVANETSWMNSDIDRNYMSPIATVLARNHANVTSYRVHPARFDPNPILETIESEHWRGGGIDRVTDTLRNGYTPTIADVERILIRTVLHAGCFTANSQNAGVWANQLGHVCDVIARIANDRHGRPTPRPPEKDGDETGEQRPEAD